MLYVVLYDFMMAIGLLFAQGCLEPQSALLSLVASGLLKLLGTCSLVEKSHLFYHSLVTSALPTSIEGKCLGGLAFLFGSGAGWWLAFVCVGFFPKIQSSFWKVPFVPQRLQPREAPSSTWPLCWPRGHR